MSIWAALGRDWTSHGYPTICGGDFNYEPQTLLDSVPWGTLKATVKSTSSYTYSSGGVTSNIDYLVFSTILDAIIPDLSADHPLPSGVHSPVAMRVRLSTSDAM
eukprot:7928355-Pyramimonas_sp.AAC.1